MPDSFHSSVYKIGCCVVSQLGDDPEDTVEVFVMMMEAGEY